MEGIVFESRTALIEKQVNRALADPALMEALLQSTLKGLDEQTGKKAIVTGIERGFSLRDFLTHDVSVRREHDAFRFVTSLECARRIAIRSGATSIGPPVFRERNAHILSCSVTVRRQFAGRTQDFTGEALPLHLANWEKLPPASARAKMAEIAEMRAFREACPEKLGQVTLSEEA